MEGLDFLFKLPLNKYSKDEQNYWRAIAFQAKDKEKANEQFQALKGLCDKSLLSQVNYRLTCKNFPVLGKANFNIAYLIDFDKINHRVKESDKVDKAIISLIILNTLVFLIQFFSTEQIGDYLLDNGGLYLPLAIENNQWWRFLSAGFLHFDKAHFAFNLLALFVFGKLINGLLSYWQVFFVYFASLAGSNLVVGFTTYPYANICLLGASGAIFGLLGAVTFFHFAKWSLTGHKYHKKMLFICLFVVALQVIFDVSSIVEFHYGYSDFKILF